MVSTKGRYSTVQSLEISSAPHHEEADGTDDFQDDTPINQKSELHALFSLLFIVLMALSSLISLIPHLLIIRVILDLTMRWFFCSITAALQLMEKVVVFVILRRIHLSEESSEPHRAFSIPVFIKTAENGKIFSCWQSIRFVSELLIMAFMSVCYFHVIPYMCKEFITFFFIGVDGTFAADWNHEENLFARLIFFSRVCGLLYVFTIAFGFAALFYVRHQTESNHSSSRPPCLNAGKLFNNLRRLSAASCVLTGMMFAICLFSAWTYLIDHPIPSTNNIGPHCDPVDTTECLLPFPSSFFTVEDDSTETGLRVNIESKLQLVLMLLHSTSSTISQTSLHYFKLTHCVHCIGAKETQYILYSW